MNLTKHKKMTLAQSHVETFENTVLHKVAVTTNPREGTKIGQGIGRIRRFGCYN